MARVKEMTRKTMTRVAKFFLGLGQRFFYKKLFEKNSAASVVIVLFNTKFGKRQTENIMVNSNMVH